MNSAELITSYLEQHDWRVRENSNMRFSAQGLNIHLSGDAIANFWLTKLLPQECAQAHMDGALHIHDLYALTAYCAGWSLLDLLKQGFGGVGGKVQSAPPKHLSTALGQLVNFFYTIQGEMAGAIAISNWDTLLAPFIYYDHLSYTQVKQTVQEFIFNCNIPTRVGFQTPFTNISLDVIAPTELAERRVIIGGQEQKKLYGDFENEMLTLNTAFAEVMLAGDSRGRPFTFPIPTYNIKSDDDIRMMPYYVWSMTAKYGAPYFGNYVNSELDPNDFYSMCCRLRLDKRALRREGGLFSSAPLTGSVGIVTVNLAQVGYLSSNKKDFLERLSRLIKVAADALDARRQAVEDFTEMGLYPYARHYLAPVKECTGKYWSNHFSTIGIIGMHEAGLNLNGVGIEENTSFAERTLRFLLSEISKLDDRTNGLYNLEETPAEGATHRLAMTDRRRFPDIITAGTAEAPYYTNSTHLPVDHKLDMSQMLLHQENLQTLYTGGTVTHLFLEGGLDGAESARALVRDIVHEYKIPHFTLTPTFSICPTHGHTGDAGSACQFCDAETEIWSRAIGYLRPVSEWNDGKQQEFIDRSVISL